MSANEYPIEVEQETKPDEEDKTDELPVEASEQLEPELTPIDEAPEHPASNTSDCVAEGPPAPDMHSHEVAESTSAPSPSPDVTSHCDVEVNIVSEEEADKEKGTTATVPIEMPLEDSDSAATEPDIIVHPLMEGIEINVGADDEDAKADDDNDQTDLSKGKAGSSEASSANAAVSPSKCASRLVLSAPATLPTPAASAEPVVVKPQLKTGKLKKLGHVRKNWKDRYFLLEDGFITYFKSSSNHYPFGVDQKGCVDLRDMQLTTDLPMIHLRAPAGRGTEGHDDITMQIKDLVGHQEWVEAIHAHIEYANTTRSILDIQDIYRGTFHSR